jgi:DHA1 family inner membrane transport protein
MKPQARFEPCSASASGGFVAAAAGKRHRAALGTAMAFFRNDTVNLLNLHYGIHSLALSGGGAFFGVFLLRAGVPAPMVLATLALILAGRFVIRPLILPAARRWGLKPLVIAGTLLAGLQYPLLARIHGVDGRLLALITVSSISDTVYWTSYHAYFAAMGDDEHRGHQIGAREALAAVVGIVGPLAAGWALTAYGPQVAFDATAAVLVIAALPIFGAGNVRVPDQAPGAFRAAIPGMLMFAADGWTAAGQFVVWPLALFLTLGESFTAFGGAMAVAALVGAMLGLLLGRFIDAGHGSRAVWLAIAAVVVVTGSRAASVGHPALAVAANALGALLPALYIPTLMTAVYNQAKRSPCVLRFHIATEGGFDAGSAAGCLTAAGLLWAGAPIGWGVLLSWLGAAASFALLRRYYGQLGAAAGPSLAIDGRPPLP